MATQTFSRLASPASYQAVVGHGTSALSTAAMSPSNDSSIFVSSRKTGRFASTSVSFASGNILHTQLDPKQPSTVVVRLNSLDPTTTVASRDTVKPLWNALYTYVADPQAAPSELEVDMPLPCEALHQGLLELGAVELHPGYRISKDDILRRSDLAASA